MVSTSRCEVYAGELCRARETMPSSMLRLEQHGAPGTRTRTPRSRTSDVVVTGGRPHREIRQVGQRQRPALGAMELGDALGRLPAIELVPRRTDARGPRAPRPLLRRDHPADRLAELALHQPLAGSKSPAVTQVQRFGAGPALVLIGIRRHLIGGEARDREATRRVARGAGATTSAKDMVPSARAPCTKRRAPPAPPCGRGPAGSSAVTRPEILRRRDGR